MRLASMRMCALFVLSATMMAFELAVMRTFSVGSWSNFGSMVISIALLGYGLAGTILTFLEERIRRRADAWLGLSAALLAPSMALAHVLAQLVPFNPLLITTDRTQYLWIASYYILYAIPFFVGAVFVGVCFVAFRSRIHRLYFWNMLGAGVGGFFLLGLLFLLPPERIVAPLCALASLCALLACSPASADTRGPSLAWRRAGLIALASALSIAALALFGGVRVSEFKPISYARDFPDSRRVYHAYGPTGEYDAFRSSYFHIAPGLSDNASSAVASIPTDAFLGLYIDGDGPIGIMRKLEDKEAAYFDYLPMAAPYLLLDRPRVLLLKLGGGIGTFEALYHKASAVTVVEPDAALVRMVRDEPLIQSYTGGLLSDSRVKLLNTEPRAFARQSDERFDLAEIGLVDSVGLSQTGGYPIEENFLYTAEGLASYISRLAPGGILSITVWNRLSPPRNVPKLLTSVAQALRLSGASDAGERVFMFDQLLSTATVLVKNGPFTQGEIQTLRSFCARMSFIPCYYPGMPRPSVGLDQVLKNYRDQIYGPLETKGGAGQESPAAGAAEAGAYDLVQEDLYYYTLETMFEGVGASLLDSYVFDVRPATDDRPYYTAYVKPQTLPAVAANIRDVSEEWGYLLLVATLALSLVFGLLIVLIPMIGRRKELFRGKKGSLRVIAYFACLGIGYMLVEIYLIQRLTYFLVDPIFSNSVVIASMLVLSGIGSLASGSSRRPGPEGRRAWVLVAVLGICASCLFYIFGLAPIVNALIGLPLPAKIAIAVLIVAPAAFCLGIPFPTGLDALSSSRLGLVPWAWGVNGALSVTGTVAARLVSVSQGYAFVLACAMALYLAALACYGGNEGLKEPSL